MLVVFLLAGIAKSLTEEEQDELILRPDHLSDFIAARQVRNLTVSGKKEIAPIYGKYFRKPLIQLLQSTQPHLLQLRSMYFQSFDGIVVRGDARGMARFADLVVYDCTFNEGNAQAIRISGPAQKEGFTDGMNADHNVAD
jgi:hypothetical protein